MFSALSTTGLVAFTTIFHAKPKFLPTTHHLTTPPSPKSQKLCSSLMSSSNRCSFKGINLELFACFSVALCVILISLHYWKFFVLTVSKRFHSLDWRVVSMCYIVSHSVDDDELIKIWDAWGNLWRLSFFISKTLKVLIVSVRSSMLTSVNVCQWANNV